MYFGKIISTQACLRICFSRFDVADDPAGIAVCQHSRRDVLGDHAAGTDDTVVADAYPGEDTYVSADPYVIADGNRVGMFQTGIPLLLVQRVSGRVDAYMRGDEHIVSDGDPGPVEDDQVGVGKEIVTDMDV